MMPFEHDYHWYRLYSQDLGMACHILKILKRYKRKDVRFCLLRDLVVSYSRPFSSNQGPNGNSHRLKEKLVPRALRPLHKELIELRNTLFAHTDYKAKDPKIVKWQGKSGPIFPMSFRGFDYDKLDAKVPQLTELIHQVEANINDSIANMEKRL